MGRAPGRRRRGCLPVLVTVGLAVALLVVGVTAVVGLLRAARPAAPVAERCVADLDGTEWALSPDQAQHAALASALATRRGMPARAVTIAIATALQESRLTNIDYGDRDSVGLYQQRPSQGWGTVEEIMDPVYSTTKFLEGLEQVPGYQDLPVTQAAQAVQRSAFPDAYAQHEARARAWASALTGHSPAALRCTLRPVEEPGDGSDGDVGVGGVDAVLQRVARDLGDVPVGVVLADSEAGTPSSVDVTASALPVDDPTRAAWSVAQWAVAVAWAVDVETVTVGDVTWSRAEPTWQPTGVAPLPAGQVRLTVR